MSFQAITFEAVPLKIVFALLPCLSLMIAGQQSVTAADAIRLIDEVAPILERRCVRCHSGDSAKGGLNLSTRSAALRGGETGPLFVIGQPRQSLLIEVISGAKPRMPAEGTPLLQDEIDRLRKWIEAGAEWPDALTLRERSPADRRDWWSFQPVKRPAVPRIGDETWVQNNIDRFVLAELQKHGLSPSPEADRRTLIRRLTFDLLGLPPTPEEVDQFVSDQEPLAYERLVDRLLQSPHYGERWARHWLDIAHYADTHGFERDQRRDHAWRYRDWVIRALNDDRPYDQFLQDQIAGDALRPDDPDAVIATGFLAAGPWDFVGQMETPSLVLKRLARADDLDDLVTQVLTATCAVTVNCARCHDHKLDPILQREYYGLWAVFAGIRRGDRDVSPAEVRELAELKQSLNSQLQQVRRELALLQGSRRDLADIVGGGDGVEGGKPGAGIDPITGNPLSTRRGFLEGARPNVFAASAARFIDGVVIPDLSPDGTQITSTGLKVMMSPKTSGQAWDAIRYGPVNSQFSTKLDGTDFAANGHTLLSLHANAAITFDLAELRDAGAPAEMKLTATAGYFGQTPRQGASFFVYVDGELKTDRKKIGRDDGGIAVDVPLPAKARFLTLMATDGGNGISHDQICFADPWLVATQPVSLSDEERRQLDRLQRQRADLEKQLATLPSPRKVYAAVAEAPAVVKILNRGDPEQSGDEVRPMALSCVHGLNPDLGSLASTDSERRIAFARWVTSADNPLTRRVIVNRLWRHHFGSGLVDTPSDFGVGGSLPSHPELLDWLADELQEQAWSLKAMHRLMCQSAAYRQQSSPQVHALAAAANKLDAGNRLLWKMNPRRLDAESLRDSVLAVSGRLNPTMFGPGYRDFEYQEEYAPVYRYLTPDSADLFRRSIYRFVVRTTTHQFLTTLDCPSPANLVPSRNITTTALQSLALLNNDFMIRQSGYVADRVSGETNNQDDFIRRAFQLVFGRIPSSNELAGAVRLLKEQDRQQFCRMLLNANEFVYID